METKQHELWLLAALAAPLAHFSGCGWLTALIAAAVLLPLSFIPKTWTFPKPLALIQILWLGIVAGTLLPGSAAYWPSGNQTAVPLTLLTLAALTRAVNAPRVGAVLAFCMGLLALPAAVSGAARLEPAWLKPEILKWEPGLILSLLLINLPFGTVRKGRCVASAALLSVVLAVLVQGILSPGVAAALSDPFYQTARTIGYMEPIVAAAMTLGWYAMAALLCACASRIAAEGGFGERLPSVLVWWTAGTTILLKWQLSAPILMGLSAFLWVLSPFFQKMKKVKNSA